MSSSAQPKQRTYTGRKKVVIQKIKNESNLRVTYAKRRPVVMKKASELATLCGAETAVILTCPRGKKIYSFGHPSVKEVFDKYVFGKEAPALGPIDQMVAEQRNSRIRELNMQLTHANAILDQERKRAEELNFIKLQGQTEKWYPPALDEFTREELLQYKESIEKFEKHINEKAKEFWILGANQGSIPTYAPPMQNGVNIHGAATGSMFSSDPTASSSNPIFSIPLQYSVGNIYGVAAGSTFSFDPSSSNPCFPPPFQNDGGNFFGVATSSFSFDHSNPISVPTTYALPLPDDGESASIHGVAGMISIDQNTYPSPFDFDMGNSFAGFAEPGQRETTNNATNDVSAQIEPYGEDLVFNLEEFGDLFSELIDIRNPSGETSSTFPIEGTNSSWPPQNPLPPTDDFMIPWTPALDPEGGFNEGTGGSGYNGFNNQGAGGLGPHSGFNNEGTGVLGPYIGFNNEETGVSGPYNGFNNEGLGFNNEGTVGSGPYNGFNNEGIDGLGFSDGNINGLGTSCSELNNSTDVYGSFTGFSDGTSGLGLNDEIGGLDPFVGLNDGLSDQYGGFNYGIDGSSPYGGFNDGIGGSGTLPDFPDFDGGSSLFNDGDGGSIF